MVQMMYWHYVRHGVRPSEWLQMGEGEKLILRAFMLQEVETERSEQKKIDRMIQNIKKGGN